MPDLPTVGYDVAYRETHGADDTSGERQLWTAVLRQAGEDLFSPAERIRQDAMDFILGPSLLEVMGLAGIDRGFVPVIRDRVRAIGKQPGRPRRRRGVTFRGIVGSPSTQLVHRAGADRACAEAASDDGLTGLAVIHLRQDSKMVRSS